MESVSTILQDINNGAPSNDTEGAAPSDLAELSLVGRAERIFYRGRVPELPAPTETRIYPDGYAHSSPPQPYRIPEGYYRRIVWRAALYAVAAVLLALLAAALIQRGLLRF